MQARHMNPAPADPTRPAMVAAAVVAAVAAVAGAAWYWWPQPDAPAPAAAPVRVDAPAAVSRTHYPVPPPSDASPLPGKLPALDASDAALTEALANLLGMQTFSRFFLPESLVRHVVATVDNLPRRSYAQRLSPANPVGGLLATKGKDEDLVLAPENAARYLPWVGLIERLDARRVVAIYVHFYPLFQQAYVELGYPDGYFNDRLVQVVDHLLETPALQGPVKLVVRHVLPEFADSALESESAGRKILFRMGAANAAIVKAKLLEIRHQLTEHTPSG